MFPIEQYSFSIFVKEIKWKCGIVFKYMVWNFLFSNYRFSIGELLLISGFVIYRYKECAFIPIFLNNISEPNFADSETIICILG